MKRMVLIHPYPEKHFGEENVSVIAMVKGESAPQPPRPGSGPFGPGCTVGK